MQIITGDETGLLKLIDLNKKEVIKKYGEQNIDNKVIQITKIKLSDIEFFLVLRQTNLLLVDNELNEIAQKIIPEAPIKLFYKQNSQIIIVYRNRSIISLSYDEIDNGFTDYQQINSNEFSILTNLKDKYVTSSCLSEDENQLLLIYFGSAPSIFNIETKQLQWQARNVKNDELDLQVKMHDYDAIFLDSYSIGVITIHQTCRVYDIQKQKSQPIFEYSLKQSKYKVIQIRKYQQKYFMMNERGEILVYGIDFKFERKIQNTYGAIRDITFNNDYIYTVSLDRFLRVYNLDNVKLPLSINLSQRLTAVNYLDNQNIEIEIEKKEEKIWNIKNGKEAKARFQGMRKHTIKLPYLEKMFENHKIRKQQQQQVKVEECDNNNNNNNYNNNTQQINVKKPLSIQQKKIMKRQQKDRINNLQKTKNLVNKPKKNNK